MRLANLRDHLHMLAVTQGRHGLALARRKRDAYARIPSELDQKLFAAFGECRRLYYTSIQLNRLAGFGVQLGRRAWDVPHSHSYPGEKNAQVDADQRSSPHLLPQHQQENEGERRKDMCQLARMKGYISCECDAGRKRNQRRE